MRHVKVIDSSTCCENLYLFKNVYARLLSCITDSVSHIFWKHFLNKDHSSFSIIIVMNLIDILSAIQVKKR